MNDRFFREMRAELSAQLVPSDGLIESILDRGELIGASSVEGPERELHESTQSAASAASVKKHYGAMISIAAAAAVVGGLVLFLNMRKNTDIKTESSSLAAGAVSTEQKDDVIYTTIDVETVTDKDISEEQWERFEKACEFLEDYKSSFDIIKTVNCGNWLSVSIRDEASAPKITAALEIEGIDPELIEIHTAYRKVIAERTEGAEPITDYKTVRELISKYSKELGTAEVKYENKEICVDVLYVRGIDDCRKYLEACGVDISNIKFRAAALRIVDTNSVTSFNNTLSDRGLYDYFRINDIEVLCESNGSDGLYRKTILKINMKDDSMLEEFLDFAVMMNCPTTRLAISFDGENYEVYDHSDDNKEYLEERAELYSEIWRAAEDECGEEFKGEAVYMVIYLPSKFVMCAEDEAHYQVIKDFLDEHPEYKKETRLIMYGYTLTPEMPVDTESAAPDFSAALALIDTYADACGVASCEVVDESWLNVVVDTIDNADRLYAELEKADLSIKDIDIHELYEPVTAEWKEVSTLSGVQKNLNAYMKELGINSTGLNPGMNKLAISVRFEHNKADIEALLKEHGVDLDKIDMRIAKGKIRTVPLAPDRNEKYYEEAGVVDIESYIPQCAYGVDIKRLYFNTQEEADAARERFGETGEQNMYPFWYDYRVL